MSEIKQTTKIQSLLVGFSIIELLASEKEPLKFNDIHHKTKITKSNLYKYLNTLTSLGVLYRNNEDGTYSLGPTLIRYGMTAINKEDLLTKVEPYLQKINLQLKETTLLTTWTNKGPMIVKMIHSSEGLNLGGQVGTLLPIYSAAGKLFAAYLDDPVSHSWKKQEYEKLDKERKTTLEKELKSVPKNRIAFAKEALAPYISSVGIPILNWDNKILGGIIVVGFEKTIPDSIDDHRSQYLLQVSDDVSSVFGCQKK